MAIYYFFFPTHFDNTHTHTHAAGLPLAFKVRCWTNLRGKVNRSGLRNDFGRSWSCVLHLISFLLNNLDNPQRNQITFFTLDFSVFGLQWWRRMFTEGAYLVSLNSAGMQGLYHQGQTNRCPGLVDSLPKSKRQRPKFRPLWSNSSPVCRLSQ